ncbi:unnamed protein product, partial [Prorocentrum cordatum]
VSKVRPNAVARVLTAIRKLAPQELALRKAFGVPGVVKLTAKKHAAIEGRTIQVKGKNNELKTVRVTPKGAHLIAKAHPHIDLKRIPVLVASPAAGPAAGPAEGPIDLNSPEHDPDAPHAPSDKESFSDSD